MAGLPGFDPSDPVRSTMQAPAASPLGSASTPIGGANVRPGGMPAYGSALLPYGTADGTMLDPATMQRLMGVIDDPEAQRHKFLGALLQGTRSGSAGEAFGNAYSALGDFEQRQMELRMQYVPLMLREFNQWNQQVREWDKYHAEQSVRWRGMMDSSLAALGPNATDQDAMQALQGVTANSDIPPKLRDARIVEYWQERMNGVAPKDIVTRLAAMGDPELRRSYWPPVVTKKIGTAEVPFTEGRAGIGPGTGPTGAPGVGAKPVVEVREGPDGQYLLIAGQPYATGDPRVPRAIQEATAHQLVSVPPPGGAGAPPPPPSPVAAPAPPPALPGSAGGAQPPPGPPVAPAGGVGGAAPGPGGAPLALPGAPGAPVPGPGAVPGGPGAPVATSAGSVAPQNVASTQRNMDLPPPESYGGATVPWSKKSTTELHTTQAKEFQKELDESAAHITTGQKLLQRLSLVEDVARQFRTGTLSGPRAELAGSIKDLLVSSGAMSPDEAQNITQRIAGGDIAAYQMFNQIATTMAMVGARMDMQTEGGGGGVPRFGQQEFLTYFGSKINPRMDPKAIFNIIQSIKDFQSADVQKHAALNTWWNEYNRTDGGVKLNDFDQWWNKQMSQRGIAGFSMPRQVQASPYAPPANWLWTQRNGVFLAADPNEKSKTGQPVWRAPRYPGVNAATIQRLAAGAAGQAQQPPQP